jgi:hypothetical protein
MRSLMTFSFISVMALSPLANALQCGGRRMSAVEIRNLANNRGPVRIGGQVRYGLYTFNKGRFGDNYTPSLFCGANNMRMFQYHQNTKRVEFFECRGGQIYYNLDTADGVKCY